MLELITEIDEGSSSKISYQIAEKLRILILSGKYLEGQQLPSIRNISQHLRVSPSTASEAFRILYKQGLAKKHRGLPATIVIPYSRVLDLKTKEIEPQIRHLVQKTIALEYKLDQMQVLIFNEWLLQKNTVRNEHCESVNPCE